MARYLVIFKAIGTNPNPRMEEGWLSIAISARSEEEAERWGTLRAKKLGPWLRCYLELFKVELYHPTPEMAGPYRGLVLGMD